MKIPALIEFVQQANISLEVLARYLNIDLNRNLREIVNTLKNLAFEDNFESFTFTGTILPNSELAIRNQFRGGIIPTKRLIVRGDSYSLYVVDGDSGWTQKFVSLKNTHATQSATLTVVFFK